MNMANPETCDRNFRRATSVTFTSVEPIGADTFKIKFDVTYSCRCNTESCANECANAPAFFRTIFDDYSNTNQPDRQNYNVDLREEGPVEPPCVCAIVAKDFRAPRLVEFSKALEDIIEVRRLQGVLSFVESI